MAASAKAKTHRGARTRRRVLEVTRGLLSESGPRSVTLDPRAVFDAFLSTSMALGPAPTGKDAGSGIDDRNRGGEWACAS
jgi:hypothetical protein